MACAVDDKCSMILYWISQTKYALPLFNARSQPRSPSAQSSPGPKPSPLNSHIANTCTDPNPTPTTYATSCLASSTAHLAARFNSLFHSVSLHLDQVVNPSGG